MDKNLQAVGMAKDGTYYWDTTSIMTSEPMRGLIAERMLNSGSYVSKVFLEQCARDPKYMPVTYPIGTVNIETAPLGVVSYDINDELTPVQPTYGNFQAKPLYYTGRYAEQEAIDVVRSAAYLGPRMAEVVNQGWTNNIAKLVKTIVVALMKETKIVSGTTTPAELSLKTFHDLKKGVNTMEDYNNMTVYMNNNTKYDIIEKQVAGTIKNKFLMRKGADLTVVDGGTSYSTKISGTSNWTWEGEMPVEIMQELPDGTIAFIKNKSIHFNMVRSPRYLDRTVLSGKSNSAGAVFYDTRLVMMFHPEGFSFKGVLGTDYHVASDANKGGVNGLTIKEWEKNQFELRFEREDSPINFLKIKYK